MAMIQPVLECRIDPTKPVNEICALISAMAPYHPGNEAKILCGIQDAINKRLEEIAAAKKDEKGVEGSA